MTNHFLFVLRTGGIPARTADGERLLLYVGIIDILQSYHIRKKLEHTFKSVLTDGVKMIERTIDKNFVHFFRLKSQLQIQVFILNVFNVFSSQQYLKKLHVNISMCFE